MTTSAASNPQGPKPENAQPRPGAAVKSVAGDRAVPAAPDMESRPSDAVAEEGHHGAAPDVEGRQSPATGGKGANLLGMGLNIQSTRKLRDADKKADEKASSKTVEDETHKSRITPLPASDPMAPLWALDGVAEAAYQAGDAISSVHRHRINLRKHNITGAESVLRGARASAWLDGGDRTIPDDGNITDPTLAAALRVADMLAPERIADTARTFNRAPLQVLAKMALLAAPQSAGGQGAADSETTGIGNAVEADSTALNGGVDKLNEQEVSYTAAMRSEAGRPVGDSRFSAAMKEQRLHVLADFLTGTRKTEIHPAVMSAIVHGEILALQPFAHNNGIIARATARLVTVSSGLDPRNLGVPEVYWTRHREEYAKAADAFGTGQPEGVREFLLQHISGLTAGAVEARGIADAG